MKRKRFVIRIPHREHSYKISKNAAILWLVLIVVACCLLLLTMVVHAEEMEELRNNSNSAVIVSSQNEEQISTQQNEQEEDFKMVGWTLAGLFLFGLFLMSVTLWNMHKEHDQELDNLRTVCLEFKTRAERAEKHYRDLEYLYDDLLKRNNDNVLLYNDLKDKYDKLVRESKTTARR